MFATLAGLVAGSLHVVSGPDHLAALAPIALERRASALRVGASWGLGHGLGVVGLGVLAVGARGMLNPVRLSGVAELMVGGVLVVLGVRAIAQARGLVIHSHDHEHGHAHPHVHFGDTRAHQGHSHAAFGVGVLHGAAGASHLFGVVPALALSSVDALGYLAAYLVGAVLAMAGFGALVGAVGRRGPGALRALLGGSGAAAVAVGLAWISASWTALRVG